MNDKPGPGKFQANESASLSEYLSDLTLEGDYDDSMGDVDTMGWYAIVRDVDKPFTKQTIKEKFGTEPELAPHYILEEDTNGFFTYWGYNSLEEVEKAWDTIKKLYYG